MIIEGKIDISKLLKAHETFNRFLDRLQKDRDDEMLKAACVQAFEFSIELCWKFLKRILESRGLTQNSPKEVLRESGIVGLIKNSESWFDFLKKRNLTSHVYEEEVLDEVVFTLEEFKDQFDELVETLKDLQ